MCHVVGVFALAWVLVMSAALPSSPAIDDIGPPPGRRVAKRHVETGAREGQTNALRRADSETDPATVPADNQTAVDLPADQGDDAGGDDSTAVKRYADDEEAIQKRAASDEPTSCLDVQKVNTSNGVRTLNVDGKKIDVFCDQVTDGGGWTVIQRRRDGSVDFNKDWKFYKNGFGQLDGEFWLGLENMHLMTASKRYMLRVDLFDYDGNYAYARYNDFKVGGEENYYRLYYSSYSGSSGDSLSYSKYMPFTTRDKDHDTNSGNCAQAHSGGFWFKSCVYANLNGIYSSYKVSNTRDIFWYNWKSYYSLKFVEMKIRPY